MLECDTLRARSLRLPVIYMTGFGDVPLAVQAMRHAGAIALEGDHVLICSEPGKHAFAPHASWFAERAAPHAKGPDAAIWLDALERPDRPPLVEARSLPS